MSSLYIVVDQFGLIAGFDKLDLANSLMSSYPKVPLMVLEFPLDINEQKDEFYFLPYVGNNAIAIASNNKKYILNIKTQLLTISMTYPDSINFYTRQINKIHELELKRLISPEIHVGDVNLLGNINELVEKMESTTAVGGMYHEQYSILDKVYGDVLQKEDLEISDNHPETQQLQPESNDDTNQEEIQN